MKKSLAYKSLLLIIALFLAPKNQSAQSLEQSFEYTIYYGYITVGEAKYSSKKVNYNKKPALKLIFEGETTGLWNWVYDVQDKFLSYYDYKNKKPLYFLRNVHEGKYKQYLETYFIDSLHARVKDKTYDIPHPTFDIVSVFQVLKEVDWKILKKGEKYCIDIFYQRKHVSLLVKKQKTENISTNLGDIDTYKLSIIVPKGKVFKTNESIVLWVSQQKHIPIKVEIDLPFANVSMEINSFKNAELSFKD